MDRFTAVPNVLLDEWAAQLTDYELRVLLYVLRRTVGWHQEQAPISLRQFAAIGLPHGSRLSTTIKHLEARGLLRVTRGQAAHGGAATTLYACPLAGGVGVTPGVRPVQHQGGEAVATPGVVPVPPQEVVTPRHHLKKERQTETEATRIWTTAREHLRGEMTPLNWEARIGPLVATHYAGGVLTLAAPTSWDALELQRRWAELLAKAVRQVTGGTPRVEVVAARQTATR